MMKNRRLDSRREKRVDFCLLLGVVLCLRANAALRSDAPGCIVEVTIIRPDYSVIMDEET